MDLKRYESQDAACIENILENCRKIIEDADLKITAFLNAVDAPHELIYEILMAPEFQDRLMKVL